MAASGAGLAIQNCPKLSQDIKLLHICQPLDTGHPRKGHDLGQGSFVAEAIAKGWQHAQQQGQWAFSCRVTWAAYLKVHQKGERNLFPHVRSPWPGELEKEITIISNPFHGSVPWLRSRQAAEDAWCMSIHTQSKEGGGRPCTCQATLRSWVGKVTITVMNSLADSEGRGELQCGREMHLSTVWNLFGVHQKCSNWSTLTRTRYKPSQILPLSECASH